MINPAIELSYGAGLVPAIGRAIRQRMLDAVYLAGESDLSSIAKRLLGSRGDIDGSGSAKSNHHSPDCRGSEDTVALFGKAKIATLWFLKTDGRHSRKPVTRKSCQGVQFFQHPKTVTTLPGSLRLGAGKTSRVRRSLQGFARPEAVRSKTTRQAGAAGSM